MGSLGWSLTDSSGYPTLRSRPVGRAVQAKSVGRVSAPLRVALERQPYRNRRACALAVTCSPHASAVARDDLATDVQAQAKTRHLEHGGVAGPSERLEHRSEEHTSELQ